MTPPAVGPGIAGVPGAPVQPDQPASPQTRAEKYGGSISKYIAMTRRTDLDRGAMMAELDEAFADGQLTRDEFNDIFDADMTEAAWNAFVGRNEEGTGEAEGEYVVTQPAYLDHYFEEGQVNLEVLGMSWDQFERSDFVTIVPQEEWMAFVTSMNQEMIHDMVQNHRSVVEASLQIFARSTGHALKSKDQFATDAAYEAYLEARLAAMIRSSGTQQGRQALEMLGVGLLNQLTQSAADRGMHLDELGMEDDPQLAHYFLETVVSGYITGSGDSDISGAQYQDVEHMGQQLARLEELVGEDYVVREENGQSIYLRDLDATSHEFNSVLVLLDAPDTTDEQRLAMVQDALRDCPTRADEQVPALPPPPPGAVGLPVITSGADVETVAVGTDETEEIEGADETAEPEEPELEVTLEDVADTPSVDVTVDDAPVPVGQGVLVE